MNVKKLLLVISLLWAICGTSTAQDILDRRIRLTIESQPLERVLYQLIREEGIKLSFNNALLPSKNISARFDAKRLEEVLEELLEGTSLKFKAVGDRVVLYSEESPADLQLFTISGRIRDAQTGEHLISATVIERISGKGTVTNEYGFYSLTLPEGPVELSYSYLGYRTVDQSFDLEADRRLEAGLRPSVTLTEVVVTDSPVWQRDAEQSTHKLNGADVAGFPALGGEPDLVRFTHLLPGVQTGADGVGSIHVRGGRSGHNLILLDGVP
ncbi:MAG: TonB-dependent receptor, partial [Saprospiraceae bacterium]|nr:TonB-dependent receptor [Saprospiraceae bacterium]